MSFSRRFSFRNPSSSPRLAPIPQGGKAEEGQGAVPQPLGRWRAPWGAGFLLLRTQSQVSSWEKASGGHWSRSPGWTGHGSPRVGEQEDKTDAGPEHRCSSPLLMPDCVFIPSPESRRRRGGSCFVIQLSHYPSRLDFGCQVLDRNQCVGGGRGWGWPAYPSRKARVRDDNSVARASVTYTEETSWES